MTVKTTKEVEVEIQLPYYSKGYGHYYAVLSESKCIALRIDDNPIYPKYEFGLTAAANAFVTSAEISKKEFMIALELVKSKLAQIEL